MDVGTAMAAAAADAAAPDDDGSEDVLAPPELDGVLDPLVGPEWERGSISPHCRSSFEACGGLLAGVWEVEDNCNPEIRTREVLVNWGRARMNLDDTACFDAVQRLTWTWSGVLSFENGIALDHRQRAQRVDIALSQRCMNASLGTDPATSITPEMCAAMQDSATTCGLASGVCVCSNRSSSSGTASGVYGVLGLSVAIGSNPTTRYEYCVQGDTLLWREKEGDQRHVVMRRIVSAPLGTTDPVEIPR